METYYNELDCTELELIGLYSQQGWLIMINIDLSQYYFFKLWAIQNCFG